MSYVLDEIINQKLKTAFAGLGLDTKYAAAKTSDRPDLSDFQCNGALALAKSEKKNPRQIGEEIAARLREDKDFARVSVDGPGFLNLTLTDEFLAGVLDKMAADERFGCALQENPKTVVMDYGGPNVAKEMHVGHLRSGVIGESMRRIEEFVGNKPIADVHFGDWGTPIGMILAEVIAADGSLDKMETYDIAEITRFYKQANIRCKEDPAAKETARVITAKFQDGDPVYRKAWQHIRKVSVEAVKENYRELGVHFDLWLGESDAHETCFAIKKIAEEKGLLEYDDGAYIIRLDEENKPKPPVIIEKSDGGFTYQATDIATIKMRVDDLHADEIIYFVDKRQSLHFEQVFEVVEKLGIAPGVKLQHIGFGTVNGADGKPFKTRDGGVMNLADMIKMSKDKVAESMPAPDEAKGITREYIDRLVSQIAVGAIKFQDLKNNIASGYVFELDDFANFDGKTGPYIQYAVARINSIMRKNQNLVPGAVVITNPEERALGLKLTQLSSVVFRAEADKEPSVISDYAYTLAQLFSSFYNASPIMGAETSEIAASRLALARLTRDVLVKLLYLLGIEAPEAMLKA
ncbi:MAG: arginine--tRNA ligase [Alphaproteobacteria bacterium]|jgi:arginyl-tRNA synthetase|nr:MAG: arginine--tRNA ligase [Azospirillum sp. 51_20]